MKSVDLRFYAELNDFLSLVEKEAPDYLLFRSERLGQRHDRSSWRAAHGGGPDPGE